MKKYGTCSFFGQKDVILGDELYELVRRTVLFAVNRGCRYFYFVGQGEFDKLCFRMLTKFKREEPETVIIRVYCLSPDEPVTEELEDKFDNVYAFCQVPADKEQSKIPDLYRRVIDQSNMVICYSHPDMDMDAYEIFEYANNRFGKFVINVFPEIYEKL